MQSKAYLPTAEKELLNEAMRISDTAKFTISAFVIVLSSFEKATAKMIKVFPLMNIKILKMKKCSFLRQTIPIIPATVPTDMRIMYGK